MTTFIADIDVEGSEMERPFMRQFVEAETPDEAKAEAEKHLDGREVVRSVEPLQPILDRVRDEVASGKEYGISWKSESGTWGPVVVTDAAAAREAHDGQVAVGIPFGSDPDYLTVLPWMKRADAKRLAKHLGLTLEEW